MIEKIFRMNIKRKIITEYILTSITKKEKSGYDILKELNSMSNKKITKSFLYPLLEELRDKEYIAVSQKGNHRKTCYKITEKGKKLIKEIERRRKEVFKELENMDLIIYETIKNTKGEPYSNLFKKLSTFRKKIINSIETKNKKEVERIIKQLDKINKGIL